MTFTEWNRREIARLCKGECATVTRNVRRARPDDYMTRLYLWDEYLATSQTQGFAPEQGPLPSS